jgi:hypothetical protein
MKKPLIVSILLSLSSFGGQSFSIGDLHEVHEDLFYKLEVGSSNRTLIRGDREGNGGNGDISQVAKRNEGLRRRLFSSDLEQAGELTEVIISLRELLQSGYFITCAKKGSINRKRVDAINYQLNGESYILLNCKKWRRQKLRGQITLLLHELTFLAGYDDSDYRLSSSVLRYIRVNSEL